jgi:hypothetical protein
VSAAGVVTLAASRIVRRRRARPRSGPVDSPASL